MTMTSGWRGLLALAALGLALAAGPACAAMKFPPLTGRVVDNANLLSPAAEQQITTELADLEAKTSRQLVVATVPDLQGYEIEDYGYQLGRAWGIGDKTRNDGALLLVAPKERKVRIEVGYGLEGVLTDALSALIIQNDILPSFKEGFYERGIEQGVDAIDRQLRLDPAEAQARAAAAERPKSSPPIGVAAVIAMIFIMLMLRMMGGGRGRRRPSGLGPVLIWAASEAMRNNGRGGAGGGGFGGGGGGFGGGGGSFGGGGASGGW